MIIGGRGSGPGGDRGGFHGGNDRNSMERGGSQGPMNRSFEGGRGGFHGGRGQYDRVMDKLQNIQGPTYDLEPLDMSERKFSGRARIYIGNFTNDMTEAKLNNARLTVYYLNEYL